VVVPALDGVELLAPVFGHGSALGCRRESSFRDPGRSPEEFLGRGDDLAIVAGSLDGGSWPRPRDSTTVHGPSRVTRTRPD
jgi:hypothetical protein